MRLGSAAAVTFCVAAVPVWGQEEVLPDLFSDVIDVRVVNVEVVVTDKKGNLIQGLDPSDFELRVDGEPTPIHYFTEVDEGIARETSTNSRAEDANQAAPSLLPGEPVRTNYLVFIDESLARAQDRDRVLQRLETDLRELQPVDRVAVVAFDGTNVLRLLNWTHSEDEIRDALGQARERETGGGWRWVDPGAWPSYFDSEPDVFAPARARHRRLRRERLIQRSVMAAVATVRSFADTPGRKVMLVLADRWTVPSWLGTNPASDGAWLEDLYDPLVHAANLVGYTLYPVDLPGHRPEKVRTTTAFTLQEIGQRSNLAFAGRSSNFTVQEIGQRSNPAYAGRSSNGRWVNLEPSQHAAFEFLARETGGVAMINAARSTALADAAADTRSYYWLGFEPAREQNDELHDIDVRLVGRPYLQVRSRRNYMDLSRSTEVTMLVEGNLLFGGAPGAEALDVRFGPSRKAGFRTIFVPMEVEIPLDDLTLLPVGDQWMNELEFRVTLIDEHGARSETPVSKIPILGSETPPPGETFVYETDLRMRKRAHRYVAAVYDPLSGAILSASGELAPDTGTDASTEDIR